MFRCVVHHKRCHIYVITQLIPIIQITVITSVLVSPPSNLHISWCDIILAGWRGWSANFDFSLLDKEGRTKDLSTKSAAASHVQYTRGKKNAEPAHGPRILFITPGCGFFFFPSPSSPFFLLPTSLFMTWSHFIPHFCFHPHLF